jgi:hypothetical protein
LPETEAAAGHGTTLTFLKFVTTSKISLGVASAVVLAGASWFAWSWWWPWSRTKAPPLALNGTWTRLDKPQPLGHMVEGYSFTLDPDGQLYVADPEGSGRIQKRDRDGNWSLVASAGQSPGAFKGGTVRAIACDASGGLYVLDGAGIEKRDREGHWTTVPSPVSKESLPRSLWLPGATLEDIALDPSGNPYVWGLVRVRETGAPYEPLIWSRKPDGERIRLTEHGRELGQFTRPSQWGLAFDAKGNLYVRWTRWRPGNWQTLAV